MEYSAYGAPPRWEKAFAVLSVFLSTSALLPLLTAEGLTIAAMRAQDRYIQLVWVGVYGVTSLLLITRCHHLIRRALSDKLVWVLVGLAMVSLGWTQAPTLTLGRSLALFGSALVGVYLALRLSDRDLVRVVLCALAVSTVLSLVFVVFFPRFGIVSTFSAGEAWRGIYTTKGQLGRLMALASLLWLLYVLGGGRYRVAGTVMLLLSLGTLIMTGSMTALVVFLILLGSLPILRILRWHYTLGLPAFAILGVLGVAAMIWVSTHYENLVDLLGRDVTLTGRTTLWAAIWDNIMERPLLGYGYSGFWLGWNGPNIDVWLITGWEPPHAHNGLLELWLQLGLVGVILFVLSYMRVAERALASLRRSWRLQDVFPAIFLLFLMLANVTEVGILLRNSVYWTLYVAIAIRAALPEVQQDVSTSSAARNDPDDDRQVESRQSWRSERVF